MLILNAIYFITALYLNYILLINYRIDIFKSKKIIHFRHKDIKRLWTLDIYPLR